MCYCSRPTPACEGRQRSLQGPRELRKGRWCDPRTCGGGGGIGEEAGEGGEVGVGEEEGDDNHERFVSSLSKHHSDQ